MGYDSLNKKVDDYSKEKTSIDSENEILSDDELKLSDIKQTSVDLDPDIQNELNSVYMEFDAERSRIDDSLDRLEDDRRELSDDINSEMGKLSDTNSVLEKVNRLKYGKGADASRQKCNDYLNQLGGLLQKLGGDSARSLGAAGGGGGGFDSINPGSDYITLDSMDNMGLTPPGRPASNSASATLKNYSDYLVSTGLAGKADFGGLDVKTAADICNAIRETKELFPDLDLCFVGSLQSRNSHLKDSLTSMYMDAYRQYNPGVPDDELLAAVQQQVSQDLNGFEPEDGTIAQSLFVGDPQSFSDNIVASMNGITINEAIGGSYDHFVSVRKSDVDAGWKPQNCYSPKATVDHELGHQIARLVDAHNDPEIQQLYIRFSYLSDGQKSTVLSGYAGTDIHEFIAESWSEYRNNPNCRNCARLVAERILELYGSNTPNKILSLRRR